MSSLFRIFISMYIRIFLDFIDLDYDEAKTIIPVFFIIDVIIKCFL